jgi:small subunit ribosomal protein S4
MSKRVSSKEKISRRLGVNLWGRPKSPFNRRGYGPGQHGQSRRRKLSDFGVQLQAKQKLKGYYGNITERQFRRYYEEANKGKGDTGEKLIELLERRLDAVIYRMKFVPTVFAARQFISHGHIRVNGKRVTIPSYRVKDGDVVEIKEKSRELPLVLDAIEQSERDVPGYMDVDHNKMRGNFVRGPGLDDVPYPVHMEPNLVIEFYSR